MEVGGTFTDLIAIDGAEVRVAKVPSVPRSPEEGVFAALAAAGIALERVADLVHGSTVATNAVLERKGGLTALVTTAGFRDLLQIQRQDRPKVYQLDYRKPEPVVERRDVIEVEERMLADGSAAKALDLPRLALVGIVSADAGLLLPDERAAERVVALVVQAAGRLGRGDDAGRAIIQTYRPEDPAIVAAIAAARGDSPLAWREREIALRRAAGAAPFLRTAKFTVASPTAAGAERQAKELAERLRATISGDESRASSRLLGPIPAWVPRRAGRWRQNVILRDREPLELIGAFDTRNVTVDLDPETLL